jgi:glycine dehydrogenase subunit 2
VRTGDIAKRLIDYGFHPYTVSFPLIVQGRADDRAHRDRRQSAELDLRYRIGMLFVSKKPQPNPKTMRNAIATPSIPVWGE